MKRLIPTIIIPTAVFLAAGCAASPDRATEPWEPEGFGDSDAAETAPTEFDEVHIDVDGPATAWLHNDYAHGVGEPWMLREDERICSTTDTTVLAFMRFAPTESLNYLVGYDIHTGAETFRREYEPDTRIYCSDTGESVLVSASDVFADSEMSFLEIVGSDDGETLVDLGSVPANRTEFEFVGQSGDITVVHDTRYQDGTLLGISEAGEEVWSLDVEGARCLLHEDALACGDPTGLGYFVVDALTGSETFRDEDSQIREWGTDGLLINRSGKANDVVVDYDGTTLPGVEYVAAPILEQTGRLNYGQVVKYSLVDAQGLGYDAIGFDSEGSVVYNELTGVFPASGAEFPPGTMRLPNVRAVSADGTAILFRDIYDTTALYNQEAELLADLTPIVEPDVTVWQTFQVLTQDTEAGTIVYPPASPQ